MKRTAIVRISSVGVLSAALNMSFAQQPSPLPANYIQVSAPMAQRLTLSVKEKHPEIKKLGLHATPALVNRYAIIGSETPSKIGKKSSDPDMKKVAEAKPAVERLEKDKVYDLFLPLTDAKGRDIGQVSS